MVDICKTCKIKEDSCTGLGTSIGFCSLFDRYMFVSMGRCTSVNVGRATKNYDMASFIKVPCK
jgi:hypothetical protein